MLVKQKSITSQKLGSQDFCQTDDSVLSKVKSIIPHLFNGMEKLCSAFDKANLLAKNFPKNSNLGDSEISTPFSLLELI